jgi:predicted Holliday junction resolvase-like endonuclease
VLKYEKKMKEKKMKQNEILEYNTEALRANSIRKDDTVRGGSRTKM